jgi:hypothetical protein
LQREQVPVIVKVHSLTRDGYPAFEEDGSPKHHYVLVTGTDGEKFTILDPGRRAYTTLDVYQYDNVEVRVLPASLHESSRLLC